MLSLLAVLREISDYEATQRAAAFAVSDAYAECSCDRRIKSAVFKSSRKQFQYKLGEYSYTYALAGHGKHGNTFF